VTAAVLTPLPACIPLCDTLSALALLALVYLIARAMTPNESPTEDGLPQAPAPASLPASAYRPGERVRITAGPFRGMEAVVDRVNPAANLVLLHLEAYGRPIQVGEPADRLEPIR
jgi:transcription antitermination factor NusG